MRRIHLCAGAVLALTVLPASPLRGQSAEDEVVQVVQDLFDAMRARDRTALEAVFTDGARLSRGVTGADGTFAVRDTPMDQFIDGIVSAETEALLDERIYNPEVRIDGNLATVWVEYDFYLGEEFSHCGVDAFQLAHDGTAWRIFQIADTRQREGCPSR
jgi:hypothetical protein